MERIEAVSRGGVAGIKTIICKLVSGGYCRNCIITKWMLDNQLSDTWPWQREVLIKLNIEKQEGETECYALYKYMYKKEIEKKVRVWKELK